MTTDPMANEPIGHRFLTHLWRMNEKYPKKKAMVNVRTGESVTYLELHTHSLSIAAFLRNNGFGTGDIACVALPNCWQWAAFFIGATLNRGAISGVNPVYTSYEMERQFNDCKCKAILTNAETMQKLLDKSPKNLDFLKFVILIDDHQRYPMKTTPTWKMFNWNDICNPKKRRTYFYRSKADFDLAKDVALIPYSSGTTGPPKGVMLTHRNLNTVIHLQLRQNDTLVSFLTPTNFGTKATEEAIFNVAPFFHMIGFTMSVLIGLLTESTAIFQDVWDVELYLQTIEKYKVRIIRGPPPLVVLLTKSPLVEKYDLSSIAMVLSGGAPVGKELCEELKARLPGIRYIGQGYGMTEMTLASHGPYQLDGSNPYGNAGRLLPGFEQKIINHITGAECTTGQMGEIWVRGPSVMLGYLNNPKATAETIDTNGWLHTGDLGYLDPDGYLFICDRLKELIKVRGYQVAPAELEDTLMSHPNILDAAVIGIPDPSAGELPKAFIVKGNSAMTKADVDEFMKDKVAYYKQLKGGIEFVDEIPKSPSGKILRRVLRDLPIGKDKAKL